ARAGQVIHALSLGGRGEATHRYIASVAAMVPDCFHALGVGTSCPGAVGSGPSRASPRGPCTRGRSGKATRKIQGATVLDMTMTIPSMAPCVLGDAAWTRSASVGRRLPEPPANAPPAPSTQPCPRPAVLRPAGARPAGARPLAGASPCLRRTRDLPLEAEAAARSSRGNIDGPNNPTKHGRELLGGHMPHANPTPTPQDF
ncbi:unnamed protein product, partial [Prorocentrum cordatum]